MTPGGATAFAPVVRFSMHVVRRCVVATIQADLQDAVLMQFQIDLLQYVTSSNARGVVLDLSSVELIDAHAFRALRKTTEMASLLGASSVLIGLRPGVVSSLVDLIEDLTWVRATSDLEEALTMLASEGGTDQASPIGRQER